VLCPCETTYFIKGSEDEAYEAAMKLVTDKKWWHDDGRPVIKPYFFKSCRPFFIRNETIRTCACRYHNQFRYAMEDMVKSYLWKVAHAACGNGGEGEAMDGAPRGEAADVPVPPCQCSECESQWCQKAWASRSGAVDHYLCKVEGREGDEGQPRLHKWACVVGECPKCGFGTAKRPRLTPMFTCRHAKDVEATIMAEEEGGGAPGDEEARAKARVAMRVYTKKKQREVEEEDHERRWDPGEVGREGGQKSREKETEGLEVVYMTIEEALKNVVDIMREYIIHNHIAVHQSFAFNRCRSKLRPGDIMIVLDFSMNYSHKHQDALQSDHWGAWQTTILPAIIYRVNEKGQLLLEAYVFYSDDLHHSNKFVQHCIEKLVKHYQGMVEGEKDGKKIDLRRVFLWSDGCSAQFKSRHMMLYEAVTSLRLTHTRRDGEVVESPTFQHHFFASCHGKNLCDAMAGLIKSWLERLETRNEYYRDTVALKPFFASRIDRKPKTEEEGPRRVERRGEQEEEKAGEGDGINPAEEVDKEMERATAGEGHMENYGKRRFSTIVSEYIPFGDVDHVFRFDAPTLDGIKSFHSFMQLRGDGQRGTVCTMPPACLDLSIVDGVRLCVSPWVGCGGAHVNAHGVDTGKDEPEVLLL
jgi:hypothetical protein